MIGVAVSYLLKFENDLLMADVIKKKIVSNSKEVGFNFRDCNTGNCGYVRSACKICFCKLLPDRRFDSFLLLCCCIVVLL